MNYIINKKRKKTIYFPANIWSFTTHSGFIVHKLYKGWRTPRDDNYESRTGSSKAPVANDFN